MNARTLNARNDFHNTETRVSVVETYEAQAGGFVAVVDPAELDRASRALCGMDDCTCSGPYALTDDAGNVYHITVSA